MPNIKNLPALKKPKKTKTKKVKPSPVDYYNCLLTLAQQNWFDPVLGKKKKITACCKECRTNAPALREKRTQEIQKLITTYQQFGNSYQQFGESLAKLLKPLHEKI
ncbi:MAG: hypothetical protein MRERV_4c077 [Mycoplasmataceae bacterium RV_VA103A]|nr:MAG: hypothetical protein MRERV_11c034 [Mycoplasmataceae bacterium RV_VA103A]KLL05172.1 MAG: hypothetical protein MRERV_4c077 [Mycoplasmataceae bacterium RV_VA103A]